MFGRRTKHTRSDLSVIDQWLQAAMSARTSTGQPVPFDELPITQGVTSLIADAIADMDLYAVDATGRPTGQQFNVLDKPNPDEDRADTLHKIVQSMMWTGNAYALTGPRDDSGAVDAINVLNPDTVAHVADQGDPLRVALWSINGRPVGREAITLWKLNDDPRKGPLGRSPLAVCTLALETYGWAYRYLGDYFANGGVPSSVLKSKMELDPAKILELSEEWISARRQTRPAFLPNWLELDVPPSSGELGQVIDVLGFAAAEVARLLNMPVTVVNAPVQGYSLTYNNVGDEFRRWLALGLGTTWVRRIERGFTRLLPPGARAHLDATSLFPAELLPELTPEPLGPDPTPALPAVQEVAP